MMSVVQELIGHLCVSFRKVSTQILCSLKKLGYLSFHCGVVRLLNIF